MNRLSALISVLMITVCRPADGTQSAAPEQTWKGKQTATATAARQPQSDSRPSPALVRRIRHEIRDVVEKEQPSAAASLELEFPGTIEGLDASAAMQLEKDVRFRRLYDQVRTLLDGWDQRTADSEGSEVPAASVDRHPEAESPESADQSSPQNTPSNPAQLGPDDRSAATSDSNSASEQARAVDLFKTPAAVVDGPIDRLALANNLYATGQLVLALEMYEQIDQSVLSRQDQYWIEYQMACCMRKLRRIPEAQSRYRRLAAQPEAGVLNELSRWWLDRISDRATLEADIQRFQKIIDSIREAQNVQLRTQ